MPAWLAAALPALLGGIWSAKSAADNRKFQERMSNTAHQREVEDLRKAGLNPLLSANRGASQPSGSVADTPDFGSAVASALAVKRAQAEVDLLKAQTSRETASAQLAAKQAEDLFTTQPSRTALMEAQAALAGANAEQARRMLPHLVARAKEEVQLTVSSARAQKARAVLDEIARTGAVNLAEFENQIGSKGPWVRLLLEAVRSAK